MNIAAYLTEDFLRRCAMEKTNQEITQASQVDVNRRRLTKAGLAAPAVMGTLASKRVLGASYYCTVSGQVSGNTSTHGPDTGCSITGALSPNSWVTQTTWPISKSTKFNGLSINGVTFPSIFYTKHYGNGTCAGDSLVNTGGVGNGATLFEVLTMAPSACDAAPSAALLTLARAAIATVLNASKLGTAFPINEQTAMAMFNAVYNGTGSYLDPDWLNKLASWNAADVLCYFRLLYGEVSGCSGLTT